MTRLRSLTRPRSLSRLSFVGRRLPDGARLAVGTLTAIPVPPPRRVDAATARTAMLLAPLVGLLPATVAVAVGWAATRAAPGPLVVAVLVVAVLALTTRGLHLDGLADTADGLASSYDRDRALQVMRRGDVGPAGVVTLVLVLLAQTACLAQATGSGDLATATVVAVVSSRTTLPLLCARGVPLARTTGLGSSVIGTVPRTAATAVLAATCGVAWLVGGPAGAGAVLAAAAAAGLLAARCVRRLGGLTGDVLGAGVELGGLAALFVLAAW